MNEKTYVIKRGGFGPFLKGALIGASLALLLAPRSGKETRTMLTERSTELRDKAMDMARDTRERAGDAIHDVRNKIDETVHSVKQGAGTTVSKTKKQLKRELAIDEDINNPIYPL